MSENFPKTSLAKTFLLPALLVFAIPALAWPFFSHAEWFYNIEVRDAMLAKVRNDPALSDDERADAIRCYTETPFSRLILNERFAAQVTDEVRMSYAMFRWAIRLSVGSVVTGVVIFVLGGVGILLSSWSRLTMYLSLVFGFHFLRWYGAVQAVVQGVLLVGMSFWGTALWFQVYLPKLILLLGLAVVAAVCAIVKSIFTRSNVDMTVAGQVFRQGQGGRIWHRLRALSTRIGTWPPDQIIVGLDDNFFVTEQPVTVGKWEYSGRTLYMSLPLLKQLSACEADAIIAHELAHFSGGDTTYSKRIAPLLSRYGRYLGALHDGGVTRPIYYYMLGFRALFEGVVQRTRRDRELRADRMAAEITSPQDFARALLRTVAYSEYRESIRTDIVRQVQVAEQVEIGRRIEAGFPAYAAAFGEHESLGQCTTDHPFDSHPPLGSRCAALGISLTPDLVRGWLAKPGDGGWYHELENAAEIERQQWAEYGGQLRAVQAAFPERRFGPLGELVLDFEKVHYASWRDPVWYREITQLMMLEAELLIRFDRHGIQTRKIPFNRLGWNSGAAIEELHRYYNGYFGADDGESD